METHAVPQASGPGSGYRKTVDKNVFAQMRDGVKLALDVYRPDAGGRFPALLSMTPYCKDVEALASLGPQIGRFNLEYSMVEGGDSDFWVHNGYVHVVADVRGTGNSEDRYHGISSRYEAWDGYDLVEWIAEQEWCDGNVGMTGLSYLGFTQLVTAAEHPPHLKAIFPLNSLIDFYRDLCYHGGIPSRVLFFGHQAIHARNTVSRAQSMYDPAELRDRVDALLADEATNYARNPALVAALRCPPETRPMVFDGLVHPHDGPFWREMSPTERLHEIEVPTYLGAEVHAHPTSVHLPGATDGWGKLSAPKKMAIRPCNPGGLDRPFHQHHEEMLRWYDHWLKGVDTGLMDEPAVKVWVRGREKYRYSEEWPFLGITTWTRLYLRGDARLTVEEPPTSVEPSARLDYDTVLPAVGPMSVSPPPGFIRYTTEPFLSDVEVVGPMVLNLYATLSADDGDFIVSVRDVAPDGSDFALSRGWLRASHREVDPERSEPWKPFHPHTNPVPVTPDERYEYAIELRPIANLFKAGHRLEVEIWPCDHSNPVPGRAYDWTQFWGFTHHIPYGKPVSYQVHHEPDAPSHLLIPVIDAE